MVDAGAGPKIGDARSLWNFTPSPGWTKEEAMALRACLKKFGIGKWVQIVDSGVLPGKQIQQLNGQTQRLLGKQSLAEYTGMRLDIDRIRMDNDALTDVTRKNGLITNQGGIRSKETLNALREENLKKYGLSEEEVQALELPAPPRAAALGAQRYMGNANNAVAGDVETTVAKAMGFARFEDVPEAQRMYASKIAKKLEQNAKTLRGELETATKMYDSGVKAYGRGMYDDAVKWFKAAAEETSETSLLGGRIQIYLALSLDAYGQRDKALDIYAYLESVHPEKSIRKQAEELRFILEAPRMEIGENERVDVPLLRDPDAFAPYSDKWCTAPSSSGSGARAKREKTLQQEYGGDAGERFDYDKLRLGIQIVGGVAIAVGLAYYSTTVR